VWIVGSNLDGSRITPIAWRWDGTRWRVTKPIRPGGRQTKLNDVTVDAAGQVWAVGAMYHWAGTPYAVAERWTGDR